jgi:hypothetical protein
LPDGQLLGVSSPAVRAINLSIHLVLVELARDLLSIHILVMVVCLVLDVTGIFCSSLQLVYPVSASVVGRLVVVS